MCVLYTCAYIYLTSEGKEDMLQIGEEMSRADQAGRQQPKLCTVKDSDKPELGKLKRVVLRMTAYKPNDRYKASDVVKNIGTITGSHRYY